MGRLLNPDNSAFQVALNSKIYVDKTGLIGYTNSVLNTDQALICNSRPRRFGKSMTANMLTAYYSRGCDSEQMFSKTVIGRDEHFKDHLNRYDVIHFDAQWCMAPAKSADCLVGYIQSSIIEELNREFAGILQQDMESLADALSHINQATGRKFIIIIDEWDVLIRDEAANSSVQEEYINFLRSLFKGTEPTKFLRLAFLTGILPIKKVKTQSALNNFDEFTMLDPGVLAPYIGFTEEEVKVLCGKYNKDFGEVRRWYDGYILDEGHVYNPKAVVSVMLRGNFKNYWSKTGTYESILPLICMNFDGLKAAVIAMLSGACVKVKVTTYQNDMFTFKNKDDVLTALIHLGYLAYHQKSGMAYIPNEEIRTEFEEAIEETKWNEFLEFQRKSEKLLDATLEMDNKTAAEIIEQVHMEFASAIQYNDENSLSCVLTVAYLGAMRYYFIPVREFPTGRGFADYVFIPKPEYVGEIPALVVELKWNKSAGAAIRQVKERNYTQALERYTGNILTVGVNYDKKSKIHECIIEHFVK